MIENNEKLGVILGKLAEQLVQIMESNNYLLAENLKLMKQNKKLRDALEKEKSATFIHELLQEK